jgi:hypothetical protein
MTTINSPRGLTRRQLLARASAAGATIITGAGFIAAPNAAWAYRPPTWMRASSPRWSRWHATSIPTTAFRTKITS